jgi:hypothetical protein
MMDRQPQRILQQRHVAPCPYDVEELPANGAVNAKSSGGWDGYARNFEQWQAASYSVRQQAVKWALGGTYHIRQLFEERKRVPLERRKWLQPADWVAVEWPQPN